MTDNASPEAGAPVADSTPASTPSILDEIDNMEDELPRASSEASAEDKPDDKGSEKDSEDEPEPNSPEAEDDSEEPTHLKGNFVTTARDGTKWTKAQLLEAVDKAKEVAAKEAAIAAREQQWQQYEAARKQQEQFIPQAISVLQAQMPKMPDPALLDTDPIEYQIQRARYDLKANELVNLQRAHQQQLHEARVAEQQKIGERLKGEQEKLLKIMPELKQPEKAKEFYGQITQAVQAYGFEPKDAEAITDHRLMPMIRDAMQWREMQAKQAKVADKVKDVPPVKAIEPVRRTSTAERERRDVRDQLSRLQKSGKPSDAEAFLANFD